MAAFAKSLLPSTLLTPPAVSATDAVADPDSGGCTTTVLVNTPESTGIVLGLVMVAPPFVMITVTTVPAGVFGVSEGSCDGLLDGMEGVADSFGLGEGVGVGVGVGFGVGVGVGFGVGVGAGGGVPVGATGTVPTVDSVFPAVALQSSGPSVLDAPSTFTRTVHKGSLQQTPSAPQKPQVRPSAQPPPTLSSQQTSPSGTPPPLAQQTSPSGAAPPPAQQTSFAPL